MKGFWGLFFLLVAGAIAAVMMVETTGEKVTIRTWDAKGVSYEARVWICDSVNRSYLRADKPELDWLNNIRADSDIVIVRDGKGVKYRGRILEGKRDIEMVDRLMAEKYELADLISAYIYPRSNSTPIELRKVHRN